LGLTGQSLEIYRKWFEAKQPSELHIYEKGRHGFSLQKQNLPVDGWIDRFEDWMKMHGL
jgi:dipeptidyl aminopeptidase/acylaminoacyl peptidase